MRGKGAAGLLVFDEKNETTNVLQQHVSRSPQTSATKPAKIFIDKVILFLHLTNKTLSFFLDRRQLSLSSRRYLPGKKNCSFSSFTVPSIYGKYFSLQTSVKMTVRSVLLKVSLKILVILSLFGAVGTNSFDLGTILQSCCTYGKQLAHPTNPFGACSDFEVPIPNVPLEHQVKKTKKIHE